MRRVVEVRGLYKRFGRIEALRGLSAHFPRGVSGLVGPNGSGKTTMIHVLAGLVRPDAGEARVLGLDCWRESLEVRRRVGFLLEEVRVPPHVTVRKYLERVAKLKGASAADAAEVAERVGLAPYLSRRVGTLSAGMLRMLGLAQALVGDPELVVMDEPTANLDPIRRAALADYVREAWREGGVSFLISSHNLLELEEVCEWAALIHEGRLIDQGPLAELYSKYGGDEYELRVSDAAAFSRLVQELGLGEVLRVEGSLVAVRATRESLGRLLLEASRSGVEVLSFRPASGLLGVFRRALSEVGARAS